MQKSQKVETTHGPLTNKQINKMWCIYTMEHYAAIKREKIANPCYKMEEL